MMSEGARHVLVCLRYGIGDLVMELPVIDALRRTLPEAVITGLGAEPAIEVIESDGRFNEIVSIRRWGIRHLGDTVPGAIQDQFREWLVSSRFDLILDSSHAADVLRSILGGLKADVRDCSAACLNEGLTLGMDGLSAVKRAAELCWQVTVPDCSYPAVRLREQETGWVHRFLEDRGMIGSVGISPGASGGLKRWPVHLFADLCRRIATDLKAPILIFAGPPDSGVLPALTEQTRGLERVMILENLHLRRVAAMLAQCRVYVGNDSGLMHLAAGVGTPVVALFGPTLPRTYLPTWVRSQAVVSPVICPHRPHDMFGHPGCVLKDTCLLGSPCIHAIDPNDVHEAVQREYHNARASGEGA
jgi:ADP-heptose:LPS heptosyltransferase